MKSNFCLAFLMFSVIWGGFCASASEPPEEYLEIYHEESDELSQKAQASYQKLKDAVKTSTANEFSDILADCYSSFFGDDKGGIESPHMTKVKFWWFRALESGMEFSSLREASDLPIVYFLLNQEGIKDRLHKIKIFAYYGDIVFQSREEDDLNSIFDSNLHYALKYLEEGVQKDEDTVFLVLDILFPPLDGLETIWGKLDTKNNNSVALDYLEVNHTKLLAGLLSCKGPGPALKLIDIIFTKQIKVIQSFEEEGTQITIPVGCNLLDEILRQMEGERNQIDKKHYIDMLGSWEPDGTFIQFVEHYLGQGIFSHENIKYLSELRSKQENILEPKQWDSMQEFSKLGLIRDSVLAYLGQTYLSRLVIEERSEQFEDFIKYLRRNKERLELIEFSDGLEQLFFLGKDGDLALEAAAKRSYDILCTMMFLLGERMIQFDEFGNSTFHRILLQKQSLLPAYEPGEGEVLAEKIFRLFIFSERITHEPLLKALNARNLQGETCLSMAAKSGLYQCFETIRNFLLTRGVFYQNDHTNDEELNLLLLRGMKARTEATPVQAIEAQKEALDGMIENYFSLNFYDETDEKHLEFMKLIMLRLEQLFDHKPEMEHGSVSIYPRAFKMIRRYFEKGVKSRAFIRAPLTIQMSYYDGPIRILVSKIIDDFPEGVLDAEKILSLMLDDFMEISPAFKDRIKELIAGECLSLEKAPQKAEPIAWKNSAKWLAWAYFNPK
ncbi:MAG: hypothetical protein HRU09_09095 [Oligoflexales bacterium]|nr:hypothetical protein [Oligoflexales bacterium]